MLPAKDGDCLILRWGEDADARHIVVDLGRSSTWKFARRIFSALANVELLAITHVDADHVSGAVAMFNEKRAVFLPKDVWFNARHNLMKAARPPRSVEEFRWRQCRSA
jgi:glyoxylase-like metal-dependent hydrolase (beta-lactamase superfamily II)